mgnify:CR=1 FL=1
MSDELTDGAGFSEAWRRHRCELMLNEDVGAIADGFAEHFGVSPAEMVFIGDEQKDIIVAKRFGCMSVLIDRKGRSADFGQEHTIINLTQLEEIL